MTKKPIQILNSAVYQMQADLCAALASPIRLQILDLLGQQELTSSDLLELLKIPKANLAQHISVLKEAGIVVSKREGQFQRLKLALPKIKDACIIVRSILVDKISSEEKKTSQLIKELKTHSR